MVVQGRCVEIKGKRPLKKKRAVPLADIISDRYASLEHAHLLCPE